MKIPKTTSPQAAQPPIHGPVLPPLETVPDAGAEELLAPLPLETSPASLPVESPPAHASAMPAQPDIASGQQDLEAEQYPDQPADLPDPTKPVLRDPDTERAAWAELLAFIHAHKDPGTTVTAVDPDAFVLGLD